MNNGFSHPNPHNMGQNCPTCGGPCSEPHGHTVVMSPEHVSPGRPTASDNPPMASPPMLTTPRIGHPSSLRIRGGKRVR